MPGPVTLLFTDIEGPRALRRRSRLAEDLGYQHLSDALRENLDFVDLIDGKPRDARRLFIDILERARITGVTSYVHAMLLGLALAAGRPTPRSPGGGSCRSTRSDLIWSGSGTRPARVARFAEDRTPAQRLMAVVARKRPQVAPVRPVRHHSLTSTNSFPISGQDSALWEYLVHWDAPTAPRRLYPPR
jgi:hypothetical protein